MILLPKRVTKIEGTKEGAVVRSNSKNWLAHSCVMAEEILAVKAVSFIKLSKNIVPSVISFLSRTVPGEVLVTIK